MTLFYTFPVINYIDEVLPLVEDRSDFVVVKKDGYTVINYVVMKNDTFPPVDSREAAILRECRGLIFDKHGYVAGRRFHKFFNVGEPALPIEEVDLRKPHSVLRKLDGSMISPIALEGNLRWTTRMGITDVAMEAEAFVNSEGNEKYLEFAAHCLNQATSPIFEWCSRKNRIVLDYPEDQLILLALRAHETGTYLAYDLLIELASLYGIPVVDTVDVDYTSPETLLASLAEVEDEEGVVLRFDDGHMCKIKTPWYSRLHRTKDALRKEKNVVEMILFGGIDDLMPVLSDEDKDRVTAYVNDWIGEVAHYITKIEALTHHWKAHTNGNRKQFALASEDWTGPERAFVFRLWDAKELDFDVVQDLIYETMYRCWVTDKVTGRRSCSNDLFDRKIKPIFKDVTWNDWLGGDL